MKIPVKFEENNFALDVDFEAGAGKYDEGYNEGYSEGLADGKVEIDTEMSDTSENPVQNKVVKKYVDDSIKENAIDIGYAYIYDAWYGDGWQTAVDVTDSITFKPTMAASYVKCYKPMTFKAEMLGSGTGDGYVFYNDYVYWDYHSLSFELYFHTFTATGEMKVVKLVYEYDDYETSPPRSITAYLVETQPSGVTKEYVDESIQSAILDSWEAEV